MAVWTVEQLRNTAMPPALEGMLAENRLVHSICIEGEPGTGRLALAHAVAGAALCEQQQGRMCCQCTQCLKVLAGAHSDVTQVDPDSGYKKDAVRELRADIYRSPSEGRAKVMILPEAQQMSPEVQNLLLKVMEEPPADTYFILICDNRYRMLTTVISRMVTIAMAAPSDDTLLARLLESSGGKAAQPVLEAMARGGGYKLLAALQPCEKTRQDYSAMLEAADRLLGIETFRRMLGLSPAGCVRLRKILAQGMGQSKQNGYLPLVSAAMAEQTGKK